MERLGKASWEEYLAIAGARFRMAVLVDGLPFAVRGG